MSFLFNILGQSAEIDVYLDGQENRKGVEIETEERKKERLLLYYDGETVSGKVNVILKKSGPKLDHQGIKIEFIGQIELLYDRGNHHEFTSLVKELARPGELIQNVSYPFEFSRVEKPFEIYNGVNVKLRYFLKVTIIKRMTDIVKELDIAVHALSSYPEVNNPIKMEVGIEDCLHIEFEYNKSKYHLKDVIVGKIYFLLVRIKIKHMDLAIIKREQTGQNTQPENETIMKYQIMDGAPVKGESIPIRVFLAGCNLTPTMREINKKFSVRYYLNLVLMDMEDRRYFKQQEITLWRKGEKTRKTPTAMQQGDRLLPMPNVQQHHSDQQPAALMTRGNAAIPPHSLPLPLDGGDSDVTSPPLMTSPPLLPSNSSDEGQLEVNIAATARLSVSDTEQHRVSNEGASGQVEQLQQEQSSSPSPPVESNSNTSAVADLPTTTEAATLETTTAAASSGIIEHMTREAGDGQTNEQPAVE